MRQLVSSMSLPSFPRSVPFSRRRSLLRWVPSGRFPSFTAPIAALRLLVAPTVFVVIRARLFPAHAGDDETSQVPGQPLPTCRGRRPRWSRHAEVPGFALRLGVPMLPSASKNASASTTVNISGLGPAARTPAVYASRTHSRAPMQDSLPPGDLLLGRRGLSPRAALRSFRRYIPSSPARLPWRTFDRSSVSASRVDLPPEPRVSSSDAIATWPPTPVRFGLRVGRMRAAHSSTDDHLGVRRPGGCNGPDGTR